MKISTRIWTIIVLTIVVFLQITFYEILFRREIALTPPGHVHAMMQLDTGYPEIIRQSMLGRWQIIDSHTTLPTPKVFAYVFFIAAGKISALLQIDPVTMYEYLRISGAILVFITTYLLISQMVPSAWYLLAILFTLVLETGPLWIDFIHTPITQWAAASPAQFIIARHFGFPHHLWGEALGLFTLFLVIRSIKKPTHVKMVSIFIIGFIGTTTLPSYFVIIGACFGIPLLTYAMVTKSFRRTVPPPSYAYACFNFSCGVMDQI